MHSAINHIERELSTFLLRELKKPFNSRKFSSVDKFLEYVLDMCNDGAKKLIILANIFNSNRVGVSLTEKSKSQVFSILLEILSPLIIAPESNDDQIVICLHTLNSLISCLNGCHSEQLCQLFKIQEILFFANISFKCLLANSVLFAECLLRIEKVSLKDLLLASETVSYGPYALLWFTVLKEPTKIRMAIIYSIIGVLPEFNESLAHDFFKEVFRFPNSADPFVSLLIGYCCNQWSCRLKKNNELRIEINLLTPVFDFIFHHQGDAVDALRHSVLDTFENLIASHMNTCLECRKGKFCLSNSSLLCRITSQPLWQKNTLLLLHRIFKVVFHSSSAQVEDIMSWLVIDCHFRLGEYSPPSLMLPCGALQTFRVACTLLALAQDMHLSQSSGELYALFAEQLAKHEADKKHFDSWILALVHIASLSSSKQRHPPVSRMFLDKVFNLTPFVANAMLDRFTEDLNENGLFTLLHCYRFRLSKKAHRKKLEKLPHLDLISLAYRSQSAQLRQEALGVLELLLCHAKFDNDEGVYLMNLFADFVETTIAVVEPGDRVRLATIISRVSTYIISYTARSKDASNSIKSFPTDCLDKLQNFFKRIATALLRNLHTGAVAEALANSLACLYSFSQALVSGADNILSLIPVNILAYGLGEGFGNPINILTTQLLVGMWSTGVENRENALQTIIALDLVKYLPFKKVNFLWNKAMGELAHSPRPCINAVASQLVHLLLKTFVPSKNLITSSESSTSLLYLLNFPTLSLRIHATMHHLLNELESQVFQVEGSSSTLIGGCFSDGLLVVSVTGPFYVLLGILRNLIDASAGTCDNSGFRECRFEDWMPVDWLYSNPDELHPRTSICERILSLAPRISHICSSVVCHSSPEGVLVAPDVSGEFKTLVPDKSAGDQQEIVHCDSAAKHRAACVSKVLEEPEYLVVNCWRSVRDLSLILGGNLAHCGLMLTSSTDRDAPWLTSDQLEQIADFFTRQLLLSRHSGAFELATAGFEMFCKTLLSTSQYGVDKWPEEWLGVVIEDLTGIQILSYPIEKGSCAEIPLRYLKGDEDSSAYCITRRSAGLPFFIQAILVMLKKSGKCGDLISLTANALLRTVNTDSEAAVLPTSRRLQQAADISDGERRLHALNILSCLVRDAIIGPSLSNLEDILKATFQGLDSPYWMIRNSSLILYSNMMERIFGVNRTRNCDYKKNRMSSSIFFAKFPGMKTFLVHALDGATKTIYSPNFGRAMLFALLNLLTRFLLPIQSATLDGGMVQAFIPFIFKCAGAVDVRIRLLAARVLTSLIQPVSLPNLALRIIHIVAPQMHSLINRKRRQQPLSHNCIHGLLLQLFEIFRSEYWPAAEVSKINEAINTPVLTEIENSMQRLLEALLILEDDVHVCPLLKQACIACFEAANICLAHPPSLPSANANIYAPGLLDAITLHALFALRHYSIAERGQVMRHFLEGSIPELKKLVLGWCLVDNETKQNGERQLWYDEVVGWIDSHLTANSNHYRFQRSNSGSSVQSEIADILIKELGHVSGRPCEPHSGVLLYASIMLSHVSLTDAPNSLLQQISNLKQGNANECSPTYLAPLLLARAALVHDDGTRAATAKCLMLNIDPRQSIHRLVREQALLATQHFIKKHFYACSQTEVFSLRFCLIVSIFLEEDEETQWLVASTARFLLASVEKEEADVHLLPQSPLPLTILPCLLDAFLVGGRRLAVIQLLDWFADWNLFRDKKITPVGRLFTPDETSFCVSSVEIVRQICQSLERWSASRKCQEDLVWLLDQLSARKLVDPITTVMPERNENDSESYFQTILAQSFLLLHKRLICFIE